MVCSVSSAYYSGRALFLNVSVLGWPGTSSTLCHRAVGEVRRGDQESVTSPPVVLGTSTGVPAGWGIPHLSGLVCGCSLGPGLSAAYLAALLIKVRNTTATAPACSTANENERDECKSPGPSGLPK